MKRIVLFFALAYTVCCNAQRPDTLWFQFDNRFTRNEYHSLANVDTIDFAKQAMRFHKYMPSVGRSVSISKTYRTDGKYRLDAAERTLVLPNMYSSNDFTKESSTYCFQRSAESEHFVVFWAKGLTKQANGNLTGGASSSVCNVNTLLRDAERIWDVYVDSLGFLVPGKSTTDRLKIEMFVVNQSDWRADGSGADGVEYYYSGSSARSSTSSKTGIFHCNAWAASSAVTVAHEIGHTFQYLVSADLGMSHGLNYGYGSGASGGNEWWEDCANWQAHKVYPSAQFSDNWGNNQAGHHRNILHEDTRYNNCYYQDWWCQKHGLTTVGRVWRESNKPEDPVEAYMRLFGLNTETFADEQFEGYAHIASMDIDRWRQYGQGYIGSEQQRLVEPSDAILIKYTDIDGLWWVVDAAYCPQNYGYNANPLKIPAVGTVVKAKFKGIAGAPGFRAVNKSYAGWRYGLVTYSSDGMRTYSEIGKTTEGEVSITVPEKCVNMWFVVMGAPTTYWHHPWDDDVSNDEQWPYAVRFENTDPLGACRQYGDYPEDYVRKDTTVVINANLAYSQSSYSYVAVQYDMDAISQALGVSTTQMKALKRNTRPGTKGSLVFAGVNADGKTYTYDTTTSTSSSTVYGHWFNGSGNVVSYGNSSYVYAELQPDKYTCNIGQYPGRLAKNKTYKIRQAIIYTHTDGKQYHAVMEVHLTVR
ncbi:MAG: DUF4859 domain-containing protein [Bacteroidaceae bacterium]|nr:DUF4859 domain-containing protein [Bacteroidaceae bacterium]